jgi:uncharacterized membrane protein
LSSLVWLTLAAIAFVGTHFLLSHPFRAPLVRSVGERVFSGIYVVVAFVTFGAMIWIYRGMGREAPLWVPGDVVWFVASLLMWFASILFVGSFGRNPALPGAPVPPGPPSGVMTITRHPLMWSFAIWAIVHSAVIATPKAFVLDSTILILALVGSALQDRKKDRQNGERWREWRSKTAFVPFTRGMAYPGNIPSIGGTILFFLVTWLHPIPAGFWRWIA